MILGDVFFCSDEHTTLLPKEAAHWKVGDRVHLWPGHVDPTVARHEQFWIVDGIQDGSEDRIEDDTVISDRWPIDLRHW